MPKDRGAEQGDVDGPLERLGMVAAETRMRVAAQQAARTFPWIGVDDPLEEQRLQAEHVSKMQKVQHFQLGGSAKHIGAGDPRHAPQENGGLPDLWHIDDGKDAQHTSFSVNQRETITGRLCDAVGGMAVPRWSHASMLC